jgi:hypothetical protein
MLHVDFYAIVIFPSRTVKIILYHQTKYSEQLNINVSNPTNYRAYFPKDSKLGLTQTFNIAREYNIDRYPTEHDNRMTMMSNGVMLVKG